MKKSSFLVVLLFSAASLAGPKPEDVLHREGDFEVRQFVVPGFERLPLERKLFAYHISEAIEAGRDIIWLQNTVNGSGLLAREFMERAWAVRGELATEAVVAIEEYYFRLLLNHGFHEEQTEQKFVLQLAPEQLETLFDRIDFEGNREELRKILLDQDYYRYAKVTDGGDLLEGSSSGFYGEGVTEKALKALSSYRGEVLGHTLSTPFINAEGEIELELHRMGGRFDHQLRLIDSHLDIAMNYATEGERRIITAWKKLMRTGSMEDRDLADVEWAKYDAKDLVVLLGFSETYRDPLGIRGAWDGFLMMIDNDVEDRARIERIRTLVPEFEARMPVQEQYKNSYQSHADLERIPDPGKVHHIYLGGDSSEVAFSGVALPNQSHLRRKYRVRTYMALNKRAAPPSGAELEELFITEYRQAIQDLDSKITRGALGFLSGLHIDFHEMLGHPSGQMGKGFEDVDPEKKLAEHYSAVEEGRAELAFVYHATDSEFLRDNGIFPEHLTDEEARKLSELAIVSFFTQQIRGLEHYENEAKIANPYRLSAQVMLNQLIDSGAISIVTSTQGMPKVKVNHLEHAREVLGAVWSSLQTIKSRADVGLAQEYLETFGEFRSEQREWIPAIRETRARLGEALHTAYLNADLRLVERDGEVVDVVVHYQSPEESFSPLFRRQMAMSEANQLRCARLLEKSR